MATELPALDYGPDVRLIKFEARDTPGQNLKQYFPVSSVASYYFASYLKWHFHLHTGNDQADSRGTREQGEVHGALHRRRQQVGLRLRRLPHEAQVQTRYDFWCFDQGMMQMHTLGY